MVVFISEEAQEISLLTAALLEGDKSLLPFIEIKCASLHLLSISAINGMREGEKSFASKYKCKEKFSFEMLV